MNHPINNLIYRISDNATPKWVTTCKFRPTLRARDISNKPCTAGNSSVSSIQLRVMISVSQSE